MFTPELLHSAEILLQGLRARNMTVTTAESCTGGLLSALLTEIPGSSDVFSYGYITYADEAKTNMIGVPADMIKTYGAVSEEIAVSMAEGALKNAGASISVAITGIAGPGGARAGKPVGLVHIASVREGFTTLHAAQQFSGNRTTVRLQAVKAALEMVQQQLSR